jgi:hypothetical protein
MEKAAFGSDSVQAYTNTDSNGGTRQDGATNIYYNFRGTSDITKKTVDFAANDVSFTTNEDGDLYVAFSYIALKSNPTATQVVVYKILKSKPDDFTLLTTIDFNALEIDDEVNFCPTQVEFDPKYKLALHIMNNCHVKSHLYAVNTIFTYVLESDPSVANRQPVSFDIDPTTEFTGNAKFCPFDDHFVIYAEEASTIIAVEKFQSLTQFNIPLANFGLTNFQSFDCMSNSGLFAVGGMDQAKKGSNDDPTYSYGIFWGNTGFNNSKFVNKLF